LSLLKSYSVPGLIGPMIFTPVLVAGIAVFDTSSISVKGMMGSADEYIGFGAVPAIRFVIGHYFEW
jgi:hypothetical protein